MPKEFEIETGATGFGPGWDGWGWGACITTRPYVQPVGAERLPESHIFTSRAAAVRACLTAWSGEGGSVATRANIALARLDVGAALEVALHSAGICHQER